MKLPSELFDTQLSHPEFRLLTLLCHLANSVGHVDATQEELRLLTGMSRESQRTALRGLEDAGLVVTDRAKRNLGKLHKNVYTLPFLCQENQALNPAPCQESRALSEEPCQENRASTHGQVATVTNKLSSTTYSQNNRVEDTTYLLVLAEGEAPKEVSMGIEKRWSPKGEDTSGDDSIGGFGLLDEPIDVNPDKAKVNRRDVRTRGRRPKHEWTTYDVAAEFSYEIGRRFPYTPGLINIKDLEGALRRQRSKYQLNPLVELEVMRIFLSDERNLYGVTDAPEKIHRKFLSKFGEYLPRAYDALGFDNDQRVDLTASTATSASVADKFIFSSDGRKFDNSVIGRRRRDQHEESLKGNQ
jgi:hypothetical protein